VVEACHTDKQRKEDSPNIEAAAAADVSGLWRKDCIRHHDIAFVRASAPVFALPPLACSVDACHTDNELHSSSEEHLQISLLMLNR
jgi:hypothetical protein